MGQGHRRAERVTDRCAAPGATTITAEVAAGRKHRRHYTIISEALMWHALKERMLAAGLHELRDEPIFRAAKTLYLQVEGETVYNNRTP